MKKVIREALWALSQIADRPSEDRALHQAAPSKALVFAYDRAQKSLREACQVEPLIAPARLSVLSIAVDRAYVSGVMSRRFSHIKTGARSLSAH